jgi:hypothetical protein
MNAWYPHFAWASEVVRSGGRRCEALSELLRTLDPNEYVQSRTGKLDEIMRSLEISPAEAAAAEALDARRGGAAHGVGSGRHADTAVVTREHRCRKLLQDFVNIIFRRSCKNYEWQQCAAFGISTISPKQATFRFNLLPALLGAPSISGHNPFWDLPLLGRTRPYI